MQFIPNGPDIPNQLLQAHEEGCVAFFCGAGISYPADLPGFKDLVDKIYENIGELKTDLEEEAYKSWRFDTTLDLLEKRLGQRSIVRTALAKALNPNLDKEGATTTHAALLDLASNRDGSIHLVTTNFDRIFNHVISQKNLNIGEHDAPCLPVPKNSRWNGLVYLHGLLPQQIGANNLNHLVITSGDFGLAYITERWAARFVSDLFKNFIVCFVGYSIDDPVLRYLMDALAADRRLGEIAPEAFAFASYKPGQETKEKIKWEAKGVIPILYESINDDHSALHRTIDLWAQTYRDGIQGKERIVVELALSKPSTSSKQDDFVGKMQWALSDPSGLPAKRFAELEPVPPLEWLESLSENRFCHADLPQFGVTPLQKPDKNLKFSLTRRPTPYTHADWMMLTSSNPNGNKWDKVMSYLAYWLLRYLNKPELLLLLTQHGGRLPSQFLRAIQSELNRFSELEHEDNTIELNRIRAASPDAIPRTPMRTLWNLLINDRIKLDRGNSDLYNWKNRLGRDGLNFTLRSEFRKLLTPKIKLKGSIRALGDWGDSAEIASDDIKNFIDWDIVLAGDNDRYWLNDIKNLEIWPIVLPELLFDIQQLLKDALDLQRELGEASDLFDRSNWYLPSILPHRQNQHADDWVLLIELLRDGWLTVANWAKAITLSISTDPALDPKLVKSIVCDYLPSFQPPRITEIARDWFDRPYPTFKRLALFAATQDPNISSDEWVSWLLSDDCWWLWTSCTLRETMRLLVLCGKYLSPSAQQHLETSILAGPPRQMYRENLESESWQEIQAHSIWRLLAKLQSSGCMLGRDAARKLSELSTSNPTWQLAINQSDEFSSWMSGTGDPDFEEQHPIEKVPRQLDKLVDWLKQKPNLDCYDPFRRNDWRDVCQEKFATVLRAFYRLSEENIWPANFWQVALQVWSEEKRVRRCWRYVAPLVAKMPDRALADLQHTATWWLESVSKHKLNYHEDSFYNLCDRYLDIEEQNDVDRESDLISHAINRPIGHITRALIDAWYLRQPNDNDGLPDDLKSFFTRLCGSEKAKYRYARLILSTNLISLFRVDRQWTEEYLLPSFKWDASRSEAKAVWMGFLWSPRIYWPLMRAFKDDFIKIGSYYEILGECGRQYVSLLTYAALDPVSTDNEYTEADFRAAMEALPVKGLEDCSRALLSALEGAGEQREQYWQNRIRPFLHKIWPKSLEKMSKPIAENMARLAIAADDKFPEALETVLYWLQPFESSYLLHLLQKSNLCSRYPQDALKLLDRIVDNPEWLPDLDECLKAISKEWPEAIRDSRYRRLQSLIN